MKPTLDCAGLTAPLPDGGSTPSCTAASSRGADKAASSRRTPSLSPQCVLSAAPRAWDTTAAKRRQAERLSGIEHIVCKIIGGLEKNIRHGCTDEQVTAIVNQWAGKLSGQLSAVSYQRKTKTLRLHAKHPAIIMELRPRLKQLQEALKPTGITEVRL
jgi:hypothetical protein